jgi:hypothetical protein
MDADSGSVDRDMVTPLVEFNHLYVTLREETLEAIAESDFISERFSVDRMTVESHESSWTATYLSGRNTYLELFAPGGSEGFVEGYSGIAFSTGRLGQIKDIGERLEMIAPGRVERGLSVRKTELGEVPRFHYINIDSPDSQEFSIWIMDFHEEYLAWRGIEVPANNLFNRGAYMKASGISDSARLDDITEVQLELTSVEHTDLDLFLRALGFGSSGIASAMMYRSGVFTLATSDQDPEYRIRKVLCTLTQPEPEPTDLCFGSDARLTTQGDSMVWHFGPETEFGS